MSLDNHLIHTCTIENPGTGTDNAYNNKDAGYGTPVENVPCRLIETQEIIKSDETQQSMVKTVYKLMLQHTVEIYERSKISKVTLEDGTDLTDTFRVTDLLVRRRRSAYHQTAMLERIS